VLQTIRNSGAAFRAQLNAGRLSGTMPGTVFARAMPEEARLTETYAYEAIVSRNPLIGQNSHPTGDLEIRIPYDGRDHFTRSALADVERAYEPGARILIGHLALANRTRTNVDELLGDALSYGSLPIRLPLPDRRDLSTLTADRHEYVLSQDYIPEGPRLFPVTIECTLEDPDSFELLDLEHLERQVVRNEANQEDVGPIFNQAEMITQTATFLPHLMLRLRLTLHLPRHDGSDVQAKQRASPVISRVALRWPTVTSAAAATLYIGKNRRSVRFNPLIQSLEWLDVPFQYSGRDSGDDVMVFHSHDMQLHVVQPGELYQSEAISGDIEVEVSDYLMSGLDARLFDCTGTDRSKERLKLTTKISTKLRLVLEDAFAQRKLSPHQHLHFEGIVPDDLRIADLVTTLADHRFRVVHQKKVDGEADTHLIFVARPEGPETMYLLFLVRGHRHRAQRESRIPDGPTFRSRFDSGDLQIYVYGQLPRDSSEITHEINSIHRALRERFDRLRTRR
jgi:hypothetical protein